MIGARRFLARLSLIAGVGLVVRLVAVLLPWRRNQAVGISDELWYHVQANLIADGRMLLNPFYARFDGRSVQSAGHPPLTSFVYAIPSSIGIDSVLSHRIWGVILGVGVVFAVGYLARELAGDLAGLVGAGIAALYPHFWINDTAIGSETVYTLALVLGMWAGYRMWRDPTLRWALAMGAAFSFAALTRSEGVLLFPLVALPFALFARGADWGRRLKLVGVVAAVAAALVGSWVVRNLATFEEPTFMASGGGQVVAFGNCDRTYSGEFFGYWHTDCALKHWPPGDESVIDKAFREKGLDYLDAHFDRFPVVAAARVGRVWGVFRPFQGIEFDAFYERRGLWPSRLALGAYYVLIVAGVYALWTLRKRRIPITPFIGLAVLVTMTSAGSLGITRYRAAVDAVLPALGGVAVVAFVTRRRPEAGSDAALSEPPEPPLHDEPRVPVTT